MFLSSSFPYLHIYINCQHSSHGNEEFPQEKPSNKFLYQLQKSEGVKDEIIQTYSTPIPMNPLFFPLHRVDGLR